MLHLMSQVLVHQINHDMQHLNRCKNKLEGRATQEVIKYNVWMCYSHMNTYIRMMSNRHSFKPH